MDRNNRIPTMTFASVYPLYVAKIERTGRTEAELREVISWLTGYSDDGINEQIAAETTFEQFFAQATLNPAASLITGVICGVKVQEIEDPLVQKARYLDKVVDELAKGKAVEKIKRAL